MEGRWAVEVTHLALARRQNRGDGTLGILEIKSSLRAAFFVRGKTGRNTEKIQKNGGTVSFRPSFQDLPGIYIIKERRPHPGKEERMKNLRRTEAGKKEIFKRKLLLLGAGIFLLFVLLSVRQEDGGRTEDREAEREKEGTEETEEERVQEAEEQSGEEALPPPSGTGTIRVLLKTENYKSVIHKTVCAAAEQGEELTLADRETKEEVFTGNSFSLSAEEGSFFLNGEMMADPPDCLLIQYQDGEGEGKKTGFTSFQRAQGQPAYEGQLEIWLSGEGFYLVNELPFETYLEYVVPSEMPASYHMEALKAQAVCARTYAYKHLGAYAYPFCEAHVDDSVSYQVYNNTGKTEQTSRAVRETEGQILMNGGEPVTAAYFSTSCGATGNGEIWKGNDRTLTPYLEGRLVNPGGEKADLSEEESFAEFIRSTDGSAYEAEMAWYRWETQIDTEKLSDNLNKALKARYEASPEAVRSEKGEFRENGKSGGIGRIQGIDVLERNEGGAVERLRIRGEKDTIEVCTEYNVRALLNAKGAEIHRNDGSAVQAGELLPSACVLITPVFDEEGEIAAWRFEGGGYGHGTGMSQNGADKMAEAGKTCEEILHFFYSSVDLTKLDEL